MYCDLDVIGWLSHAECLIVEWRETSRRKQKSVPGRLGLPVAFKTKMFWMNLSDSHRHMQASAGASQISRVTGEESVGCFQHRDGKLRG